MRDWIKLFRLMYPKNRGEKVISGALQRMVYEPNVTQRIEDPVTNLYFFTDVNKGPGH